jgi:hypothetical protein
MRHMTWLIRVCNVCRLGRVAGGGVAQACSRSIFCDECAREKCWYPSRQDPHDHEEKAGNRRSPGTSLMRRFLIYSRYRAVGEFTDSRIMLFSVPYSTIPRHSSCTAPCRLIQSAGYPRSAPRIRCIGLFPPGTRVGLLF